MKKLFNKSALKSKLEDLPISNEQYWRLRRQFLPPKEKPYWHNFQKSLPLWVSEALQLQQFHARNPIISSKDMLLFASQRYWIRYSTLLGLAMAGLGHRVTLAYTPFISWQKRVHRFEHYRQQQQVNEVLDPVRPLMTTLSFADNESRKQQIDHEKLPSSLQEAIEAVSERDVQYTLQIEDFDRGGDLYRLRLERNTQVAHSALAWIQANQPDVVLLPNGSILEMGAVYEAARYLGVPAVTYEFGEQRGRIWMAQNAEVMRQETDSLWQIRRDHLLDQQQWQQIRALFDSRQRASLWENFARLWQEQPTKGGQHVRSDLGLDDRPVFLLPANVIGDSLTLGRQAFSQSMTEWLERTIQHFANQPDVQLIVRIHPGERYLKGPSVGDIARKVLAKNHSTSGNNHIHLIPADAPVNTYDLIELADIGMVYTTTVGLEMAMSGVPVIVSGETHYRSKGFTLDPQNWDEYFSLLDHAVQNPQDYRLKREAVESAWNYAYRFFFEYPLPFPWHLSNYRDALKEWPIKRVLSEEGWMKFGDTFRYLAGEPRTWAQISAEANLL